MNKLHIRVTSILHLQNVPGLNGMASSQLVLLMINFRNKHIYLCVCVCVCVCACVRAHALAPACILMGFPSGLGCKEYACNVGDWVQSLGWEDP